MRICVLIAGLIVVALGAAPGMAPAWSGDFVLVRNAKNPTTAVSASEAKDMAIGKKKQWPRGAVVTMVLTPSGSPELSWFASAVCGVSESALLSKIKQEVFKGELRKPVIAASDAEVVAAVAADEGALGVVAGEFAKSLPSTVAVVSLK
jgi:ABC-type phosphate transport system substrate-binding protein